MRIDFNSLDRYETPLFHLCNPGARLENGVLTRRLGILDNTSDEELVIEFNTKSELNFRIYRVVYDDVAQTENFSKLFSYVEKRRMLYLENIGFFCIEEVSLNDSDDGVYKDVKAYSCEQELENKQVPGLRDMDAVSMETPEDELVYPLAVYTDTTLTGGVLYKLMEVMPLWTVSHVDESLLTKYRHFDTPSDETNILGFMLETLQDAFECIFIFDTVNRYISVYDRETYLVTTSIHLTREDLVESITIEEDDKDMYTSLAVRGNNDISISGINPIGTSTISDLHHYLSWMRQTESTSTLADKVEAWQSAVEAEMEPGEEGSETFSDVSLSYYQAMAETMDKRDDMRVAQLKDSLYKNCIDNIVAAYNNVHVHVLLRADASGDVYIQGGSTPYKMYLGTNAEQQIAPVLGEQYYDDITQTLYDYVLNTSYTPGGTEPQYILVPEAETEEDIWQAGSLILSYDETLRSNGSADDVIIAGYAYKDTSPDATDTSWHFYKDEAHTEEITSFQEGVIYFDKTVSSPHTFQYNGTELVQVTSVDALIAMVIVYRNENAEDMADIQAELDVLEARLASLKAIRDGITARLAMDSYFTADELSDLAQYIFEGTYTDEYVAYTDSMTLDEQFEQMMLLYRRAKETLSKVSEPTQKFSLDVESFVFEKRFLHFTEQLQTGCLVNVELPDGDVAKLFLTEITVNYDDCTLELVFGNRFNRFDTKALYQNALGTIQKNANSIAYIKEVIDPLRDGTFDDMQSAIAVSRTLAKDNAMEATDQTIVIDDTGFSARRRTPGGNYENEQLKITNDAIVLTDDGWRTAKIAIGKLPDGNGGYRYGVNAEVLMGELIVGRDAKLYGEFSVYKDDTLAEVGGYIGYGNGEYIDSSLQKTVTKGMIMRSDLIQGEYDADPAEDDSNHYYQSYIIITERGARLTTSIYELHQGAGDYVLSDDGLRMIEVTAGTGNFTMTEGDAYIANQTFRVNGEVSASSARFGSNDSVRLYYSNVNGGNIIVRDNNGNEFNVDYNWLHRVNALLS